MPISLKLYQKLLEEWENNEKAIAAEYAVSSKEREKDALEIEKQAKRKLAAFKKALEKESID